MSEPTLEDQAFPRLSADDMTMLQGIAPLNTYQAGQILFDVRDQGFRFFVVVSGEVEIIDLSGDNPRCIALHTPVNTQLKQATRSCNHWKK